MRGKLVIFEHRFFELHAMMTVKAVEKKTDALFSFLAQPRFTSYEGCKAPISCSCSETYLFKRY